jgi:predicted nucleic acid-binding protein
MYAAGRDHRLREPCRALLRHVEAGRLDGTTSVEVVQEILHRFIALEQPHLGVEMARATLDLFAPVLPLTHVVMQRMPSLVTQYRELSARDLVHVATCLEERISAIVTPDRAFDRVREVHRVPPDDAGLIESYLA